MQARLEALTSASSNDRFQADAKDPQTKKAAAAKTKAAAPAAPSTESEDLSHAAKMAKLRRMCERKPSGKIKVPDDVHKRWVANEGDDREKMLELLEDSNWDKDWFGFIIIMIIILHHLYVCACMHPVVFTETFIIGCLREKDPEVCGQDKQAHQEKEAGMVYRGGHGPSIELVKVPWF